MKNILLILLLLMLTVAKSQTRQPFKNIGKDVKVVTLTNGEYDEFFDEDSIQRIGSALVNINTMKLVKMNLTKDEKRQLDNAKSNRFLSVDPLTKQYPELTPYQFASNSPIFAIDRDGKEMWGNNFLFDIWLEWKFGDPTGAKMLTQGVQEKVAIKTGNMPYHNDKVPQGVQEINDHINNVQANAKIAAGTANVTHFVIKTSFDVVSTFAPIGEEVEVALKGTEIVYNGIKAERVLVGSSNKIAVIGRDFDARVLKFAAGFEKQTGTKIETFRASAGAKLGWERLLKQYGGNVPEDIAKTSTIFKENLAWAEKIKKEGYKVFDTGLGSKDASGTFYGAEVKTIFNGNK